MKDKELSKHICYGIDLAVGITNRLFEHFQEYELMSKHEFVQIVQEMEVKADEDNREED